MIASTMPMAILGQADLPAQVNHAEQIQFRTNIVATGVLEARTAVLPASSGNTRPVPLGNAVVTCVLRSTLRTSPAHP
jgi:hypothetical protein